jgi:hypothetical protein
MMSDGDVPAYPYMADELWRSMAANEHGVDPYAYNAEAMHAASYHFPGRDPAEVGQERICGDCVKPEHAAWWDQATAENEAEAGL